MRGLLTRVHYETLSYLSSKLVDDTPIRHLIPCRDTDVITVFKDVMQLDKYPLHQRLFHFAVFMRWYYRRQGYCIIHWNHFYTSQLQQHTLVLPLVWLYVKVCVSQLWFKYWYNYWYLPQ